MLEKNYTNPADKGRFGFSASGKYRAPYRLEHVWISFCIAAAVVAVIIIGVAIASIVKDNPTGLLGGIFFMSLAGAIGAIVIGIAVIVTAVILIKFIMQGFECSYLADEDKFTAIVGGTSHTVYYKEVQTVHFLPRMLRGAVRGYTVTVKISGANEEFGIVSESYIAENTTPFYIIKERAEVLRAAEERDRQIRDSVVKTPTLDRPKKAETDEMQSALDRMEQILGKDAEMPGVSASVGEALPDIARRVSPTVNGYADDLPTVGRDGETVREDRKYVGRDGREHGINDVIAQGSFRVVVAPIVAVIISVVAIIIYAALLFKAMNFDVDLAMSTSFPLPIVRVAIIILAPFYFGTVINFFRNGREYNYRANGREFVITSKKLPDERFLYTDVQSVTYKKMEFLWFIKGYKVEILTRFGITKFNYVSHGFGKLQPTSDLPFEIIRERIEQR